MGRDTGPKDKQSRRIGEKLFLKGTRDLSAKSAVVKKAYPPGMHGPKGYSRKLTEYGKQLLAKQKIKKSYRMREHQFRLYFEKARAMKGDASHNLLKLLESRLDNAVYRIGLADSRDQARQLVGHGHITVNGAKVKIPSYQIKIDDKISLREKSKNNNFFSAMLKEISGKNIPAWLDYDAKLITATVMESPSVKELQLGPDATLTVEFYSR